MRDLLGLLTEFRVAAFSVGGLQVAFHGEEANEPALPRRIVEAIKADDGSGTSSARISGFTSKQPEEMSGFRNPILWQAQNGRRLTFTGDYE